METMTQTQTTDQDHTDHTRGLANRAMLIRLRTSQWRPTVSDKALRRQLAEANGGDLDSFEAKKLLAMRDEIRDITQAISALMAYHYGHTLPWLDRGQRIITSALYLECREEMQRRIEAIQAAVAMTAATLPQIKALARQRLNGAYNETDYPTPEEFKAEYQFDLKVSVIPNIDDARIEAIGEAVNAELRNEIREELNTQVQASIRDAYMRLHGAISHMAERLTAYDPQGQTRAAKAVFHDSVVGNLEELADVLPALNLTQDPELDALCEDVRARLTKHTPQELRTDTVKRLDTAQNAREILRKMAAYCGVEGDTK